MELTRAKDYYICMQIFPFDNYCLFYPFDIPVSVESTGVLTSSTLMTNAFDILIEKVMFYLLIMKFFQ